MPIYLQFNQDGQQIASMKSHRKPAGKGWFKSLDKHGQQQRYRLLPDETLEPESETEKETQRLFHSKQMAKQRMIEVLDKYRKPFVGYSFAKSKAYEAQAKAADRILHYIGENKTPLPIDIQVLEDIASVRAMGIEEMAKLVLFKSQQMDVMLGKLESWEDKAMFLIAESINSDEIGARMKQWEKDLCIAIKQTLDSQN